MHYLSLFKQQTKVIFYSFLFSEYSDTKQILEQQVLLKKVLEVAGIEPRTFWGNPTIFYVTTTTNKKDS